MVLSLESSVFFLPEDTCMDEWWLLFKCSLGSMVGRGAAEAAPSLRVIVAVSGQHMRCFLMPLHVGNSTLNFRIGVVTPHRALLWQDLLRFHYGCSEVASSPIELL